ncbi:MAG: pyruvate kinase [Cytophagales bacterium]|nr:pyruvate kinase [Cytophagales bacterium]
MKSRENRTKIIATLGPSSCDPSTLSQMIRSNVNVFRLNFSHGDYEWHAKAMREIRKAGKELDLPVCLLQDLQGPKIRLGEVENDQVWIKTGDRLIITTDSVLGTPERISTDYKGLTEDIQIGQSILVSDGKIELKVRDIQGNGIETHVVHGGVLKSCQGLNLPETHTSLSSLTEKDKQDLSFGLKQDVDWIALSFVRGPEDVLPLKEQIRMQGKSTRVIAKIEKMEAIQNLPKIVEAADGIMVARGDLGVEIPMERVPILQKTIVKECNRHAKPVIIATHMMESMVASPRPTRAETNDVANAVIDGADAVMLSAETAVGKFPVEAVRTMYRIICEVERGVDSIYDKDHSSVPNSPTLLSDRLIKSACYLSRVTMGKGIVGMTQSGYSGFKISSFRPKSPIFVFSNSRETLRVLGLAWGVRAFYYDKRVSTDETISDVNLILKKAGYVSNGDCFVIVASMPIGTGGSANMLKLNVVS